MELREMDQQNSEHAYFYYFYKKTCKPCIRATELYKELNKSLETDENLKKLKGFIHLVRKEVTDKKPEFHVKRTPTIRISQRKIDINSSSPTNATDKYGEFYQPVILIASIKKTRFTK